MSRKKVQRPPAVDLAEVPVVGMREPCPCGSGRRYKACHGREASDPLVRSARPFEGLASECDIVALREVVPAATADLRLVGEHEARNVTLVTVLPMAVPALVRATGEILLALQVNVGSSDASRDLADALLSALTAEPGQTISLGRVAAESPRLQDLVDAEQVLDVDVRGDFHFWLDESADIADDVRASLDRADAYAHPTARLSSVSAAYWTQMGAKEHLRWFMPHPEEALLDALARLHVDGAAGLGEGTRFVGMFRSSGLVCPVWDLPLGFGAEAVEEPARLFGDRLAAALAVRTPLSAQERSARAGLTTRQVTLR